MCDGWSLGDGDGDSGAVSLRSPLARIRRRLRWEGLNPATSSPIGLARGRRLWRGVSLVPSRADPSSAAIQGVESGDLFLSRSDPVVVRSCGGIVIDVLDSSSVAAIAAQVLYFFKTIYHVVHVKFCD
uniref:Uncharacterized protein n=1 Tax=Oryza punctata TaxID=4537 RepID=A0A0E0KSY2_ORYPU